MASGTVTGEHWTIHVGDVMRGLRKIRPKSVHCVVTSPPYWGLRDYGFVGQIGSEKTPELFVAKMVEVFRGVREVLRDDGVLFLNLGDSYANDTKWGGKTSGKHRRELIGKSGIGRNRTNTQLASGSMVGIPWRVAFALQEDGWVLRSEIIWKKPSPMPQSVILGCDFIACEGNPEYVEIGIRRLKTPWVPVADRRAKKVAGRKSGRAEAR